MTTVITVNDLQEWKACAEGIEWFQRRYPGGLPLDDLLAADSDDLPADSWLGWTLYLATSRLTADRYDPRLVERLAEVGDKYDLYLAARHLPADRYDQRLVSRLVEVGDGERLCQAALYLPDDRYDPRLVERLIEVGGSGDICYAARRLPTDRYDPRLVQRLVEIGSARDLRLAACHLPAYRVTPKLRRAAKKQNKEKIKTAVERYERGEPCVEVEVPIRCFEAAFDAIERQRRDRLQIARDAISNCETAVELACACVDLLALAGDNDSAKMAETKLEELR